jgi:hypothetical protein
MSSVESQRTDRLQKMAATEIDPQDIMAKFEELAVLETEFEDAELEISMYSRALHRKAHC